MFLVLYDPNIPQYTYDWHYYFTDPAKSSCLKDPSKCWCVSAGGNTCGYGNNEQCDPDECDDRTECPGYGYWCEDAGNIFELGLNWIMLMSKMYRIYQRYWSIVYVFLY